MSTGRFVREVGESDFQTAVIERSRSVPVVVDFWAPWCGPCRTLGPHLEREVDALGGRVELAKIDTDKNPRVSAAFAIRSIPAVKAFKDGAVVDEFVGALPVPALREFLARLAPSGGKQALVDARAALSAGDDGKAEGLLRGLIDDAELGSEAAFLLAHLAVTRVEAPDAIRPVIDRIAAASPFAMRIESLERLVVLLDEGLRAGDPAAAAAIAAADPKNHDARQTHAAALFAHGRTAGALEQLLDSVARNPKHADAAARKAMLAIFEHLEQPGRDPDLARDFRRRLQIVT